jgi:glycerate dehydrogenase
LIELAGKTMGIVGFGRIGRQTGPIANAFGMNVIAANAYDVDSPDYKSFRRTSVEALLKESDVVSLHAPLTPVTPHMAWANLEARLWLMNAGIDDVAAFAAGQPRNVVN